MLGHRARYPDGVGFLERVRPDDGTADLSGNCDHGHRVHVGVAEGGYQVRGTRAAGDHCDSRPARDVCVPFGHVASTLFVAHEHVAYRRVEDWVVGREDGAARQAENDLGVLHLEALD